MWKCGKFSNTYSQCGMRARNLTLLSGFFTITWICTIGWRVDRCYPEEKNTIDCIVWERKGSFSVRFIVVLFYRHPMNVELRIIKSSRTCSVDSNLLSEIFYLHVSWFIFDCLPVGDKKGNQYRTDCNWEEHTRKKWRQYSSFLRFAHLSELSQVIHVDFQRWRVLNDNLKVCLPHLGRK